MKLNIYILLKLILLVNLIFSHSCHKSIDTSCLIEIDPRNYLDNNFQLSGIAIDVKYICLSDDVLISTIKDLKVINHDIFIKVDDPLLIKYDIDGRRPQIIGRYGRGPGEYQDIISFTVDNISGTIYINDRINRIIVYSKKGIFKRNFEINEDTDLIINDVKYFNSHLFLAQYIRGKEEFNWIIADTLGGIVSYKRNNLPPFETEQVRRGGIFKYENRISYWDSWTDTIYTVLPDFNYTPAGYFVPGEHRYLDLDVTKISSPQVALEAWQQVCNTLKILETTNYFIYKFFFQGKNGISFINKADQSVLSSFEEPSKQGIENDLDNGPDFTPHYYFEEDGEEYLIGWVDAYKIKSHVISDSFKKSTPKNPEKKRELEELAASLDENDNPVLMLVKLRN